MIPPILPTRMLITETQEQSINQDEKIITIGTSFCTVKNINNLRGGNFLTTGGVQEWRGAIPDFIIKAKGGVKALIDEISL